MTEREVLHSILVAWGSHPSLRIARVNTGGATIRGRFVRFGVPGTADICGILAPTGRLIMIECKAATGKQREAQVTMERVVTQFGGLYVLARSLEDVDAAFAAIGVFRS